MIEYKQVSSCAEIEGLLQIKGVIPLNGFELEKLELSLKSLKFKTVMIGISGTLIGKRSDCLLYVSREGQFNLTEVATEEQVYKIIKEIEEKWV